MTLTPCFDLSAANWITASTLPWNRLVTFGPPGFPAYARLRLLPDPQYAGQTENDAKIDDHEASESEQLGAVGQALRGHTRTPEDCYFCLWDGWGPASAVPGSQDWHGLPTIYRDDGARVVDPPSGTARPADAKPVPSPVPHRPKVVLPHRAYFLFRGKIADVGDWGAGDTWPDQLRSDPVPAFVWPADHAWCIANDVDPHWIGIGADTRAIERLTAHPLLDVVPADPGADQPRYR